MTGPFGGGDIKAQRYTEFCILDGHRVNRSRTQAHFLVYLLLPVKWITHSSTTKINEKCLISRSTFNSRSNSGQNELLENWIFE